MAKPWTFYFDAERCMGCHACSIACKNRHDVDEEGVDWRRVEHVERGEFPDVEAFNFSVSCMHCGDAPCENVCPADAINKRDSDGIVTVDRDACIGCHYCGWACPYGAPQYDETGLMQKCNLCLDEGPGSGAGAMAKHEQENPLEPACVDECVGGALDAGPVDEMMEKASQGAAEAFKQDDGAGIIVEGTAKSIETDIPAPSSAD